jgi:WD40 repeat protein
VYKYNSKDCMCILVPKHARQCNAVAWNPVDFNLLVCGLDKYRTDQSLLLWDILKGPPNSERTHHYNASQTESIKPLAEAGVSETIHSLAWFNNEPKCLIAGVNNKQLKIIDFRGKNLLL